MIKRLKRGVPRRPDAQTLMGRLIYATGALLHDELAPAIEYDDVDRAAVSAYLARRWFTKYRVLKWRWLEQHVDDIPAYQWLEA